MRLIREKLALITGAGLAAMLILMIAGSFMTRFTKAEAPPKDPRDVFVDDFCFDGGIGKGQMDSTDVVKAYTSVTNAWFNTNITKIMTDFTNPYPAPSLDDFGQGSGAIKLCDAGKADVTCKALSVCLSPSVDAKGELTGPPNPSPYCVGVIALGMTQEKFANYNLSALQFTPPTGDTTNAPKIILPGKDGAPVDKLKEIQYGYFCYKAALDKFRDVFADGTPFGILQKCNNKSFADSEPICKTKAEWEAETDPAKKAGLEAKIVTQFNGGSTVGSKVLYPFKAIVNGLAGEIGISDATTANAEKVKFIDTELTKAKQALDQTLEAYGQLRTAWKMHVNYVDLFSELVKYRDHIVEIRRQTDTFPNKFIDASTTHCL